ncbi:prepilin-type N-terminal cleavage/methylation domain-containing protein [Calidithermus chliarophilus]|uniref:prepilin-type N-terminal cleavage/methylation domain-containing protein n=1 Tax=Calidithermus chliarophilus TaxID=52023 RepID=UPI00047F6ACA|nr:prepilin-type N-terminal cleavage/methylation domain-containing protein [Calidithermus chliarophilus]
MIRPRGLTLIELLLVIALIGIVLGVMAVSSRRMLGNQEAKAGLNSVRQIVWQGATAAASRGQRLDLVRVGRRLQVQTQESTPRVIRSVDLTAALSAQLPNGTWFSFTPPGKVIFPTGFAQPVNVTVNGRSYSLSFSLIGEVKVQ